ncbi:MAG: restriction endonuclease subunit S [Candidatus Hodarchaeota archaeon]
MSKPEAKTMFEPEMPVVPEDWEVLPFKNATKVVSDKGKRVKQRDYQESGKIPVIDQGQDFIGGYTDEEDMAFYEELPVILFGDHTRSIKYVDKPFAVGAEGVKILKPAKRYIPKFFYFLLRSLQIPSRGYSRHFQFLKKFHLPVAPETQQKRIVAEIEKQFSRLDEAVANLKRVKANLKHYKTSILKTAMTGKLTEDWREKNPNIESAEKLIKRISKKRQEESKKRKKKSKKQKEISYSHHPKVTSWVNVQLNQLIYIAGRIGWRGLKADEYTDEGPLFLSVHALNYGEEVRYDQANHISEERYVESPEIMLYENDILLCKDGAGIGKIGIVRNLPGKATVNSSLLVIRAQEAFIPEFLYYFLSGPDLQGIVKERITGSATPHLFQRDIKLFVLSVPPLAEQKEIVNRIESHLSVIEGISYQVDMELKRADRLQQSILKKAFSGKLVPQAIVPRFTDNLRKEDYAN